MARERVFDQVGPFTFLEDGKSNGVVLVNDASCFKVKMTVIITADGKDSLELEVKRVVDSNTLILGPLGQSINARTDLSSYSLSLNPSIKAPEQERKKIPDVDFERAVYEEEPVVAKRLILVDKLGNPYSENNPFPVNGLENFENIPNNHGLEFVQITNPGDIVEICFPKNLKYYQIRARGGKDAFLIGLNSNFISTQQYWTVTFGSCYSPGELVNFPNNYKLYVTSKNKSDVTLELCYFNKI